MEHTSLCASISALLEQNDGGDAEWWKTTREHLAEAERWAHMECLRIKMQNRAEDHERALLTVPPTRKARIKSFIAAALSGRPRRWAFVIPKPTPGGAIRGVANSWREAMDAVALHQRAMREAEERREAERQAAGRHRAPSGPQPVAVHHPGEAAGAPLSVVGASSRGRHAAGPPMGVVVPPPARDFAFAALAEPAPRPGYGALAASVLGDQVMEMRRRGAVR